jgi:hypothetical protein
MGTLKEELPKKALDIAISCLGFLLALLINSAIAKSHDHDTYLSMLKTIQSEAKSNQDIMRDSYGDLFHSGGIVLRDLSTSAAEQCISNPLFAKEVPPYDLERLNKYIRDAHLTNSYRRISESVEIGPGKKLDNEFVMRLRDVWTKSVSDSAVDIAGVVGMS